MTKLHQFAKVDFRRFKAFRAFSLQLRHFNILVGPNNAGKSTILAAFRILAAALRPRFERGGLAGPTTGLATVTPTGEAFLPYRQL